MDFSLAHLPTLSTFSYSDLRRFASIFLTYNKNRYLVMPRRKTQQPEPLKRFKVDGVEVEVRDADTWLIGRGLHKQKDWELKADRMLESVFPDYFVPDPFSAGQLIWKEPPRGANYMRTASSFAIEMQLRGFSDPEVDDDSSLRKRSYQHVKKHILALKDALEEENGSSV